MILLASFLISGSHFWHVKRCLIAQEFSTKILREKTKSKIVASCFYTSIIQEGEKEIEEDYYLTSQAIFWYDSFCILFYQYHQHQHWMVCTRFGMVCLHLVVFDEAGDLFASIVKFCDGTNSSLHLSIATVASSTEIIIVGR